ncbi:haloacid dehalogenase type II [Halocynthiibacter sp.]|uniref:haloacid dehalogenase type II n=1 Tax=Halocynthiibacter sp. TaxID=1979210 RepID=UPI003C672CFB
MPITTCIFDAYGTLFDVNAAARAAAQEPGNETLARCWQQLAADWRAKQLEYTWLRALADTHDDFWKVTQDGLDWAMEKHGLKGDGLRARLMQLYAELSAYPEVQEMLKTLKNAGYKLAILSNGEPKMLQSAMDSAGISDLLDDCLSVENVGVYKPHARVYDMVGDRFGCDNDQVLFVSSNGWDAACATGYGFQTAWVNRMGLPVDRMPWTPKHILNDLKTIPELAKSL